MRLLSKSKLVIVFFKEVAIISGMRHRNLKRFNLIGDAQILVYELVRMNLTLARALSGGYVCMYYHYCTHLFINNIAFHVYLYFHRLHDMSACLQSKYTQHVRPNIISMVKLLYCVLASSMYLIIINILGCLFLSFYIFYFLLGCKEDNFFSCLYLHNLNFSHLFTFWIFFFRCSQETYA